MTGRRKSTIVGRFVPHRSDLLESPAWHVLSLSARRDVHHLNASIEQAIRSASTAYQFTANSYTFDAMNRAMALRNLAAIVAEHIAAAFPEEP